MTNYVDTEGNPLTEDQVKQATLEDEAVRTIESLIEYVNKSTQYNPISEEKLKESVNKLKGDN